MSLNDSTTDSATGTLRLTTAQALLLYLSRQYSVADDERRRLIQPRWASSGTATSPRW